MTLAATTLHQTILSLFGSSIIALDEILSEIGCVVHGTDEPLSIIASIKLFVHRFACLSVGKPNTVLLYTWTTVSLD